jgi:hypothetical protein
MREDRMTMRTRRIVGALVIAALGVGSGCAHRRQSYYPPEPGVQVRAPFVNVRVPTRPRVVPAPTAPGMGADQFAEPELDLD